MCCFEAEEDGSLVREGGMLVGEYRDGERMKEEGRMEGRVL